MCRNFDNFKKKVKKGVKITGIAVRNLTWNSVLLKVKKGMHQWKLKFWLIPFSMLIETFPGAPIDD